MALEKQNYMSQKTADFETRETADSETRQKPEQGVICQKGIVSSATISTGNGNLAQVGNVLDRCSAEVKPARVQQADENYGKIRTMRYSRR